MDDMFHVTSGSTERVARFLTEAVTVLDGLGDGEIRFRGELLVHRDAGEWVCDAPTGEDS